MPIIERHDSMVLVIDAQENFYCDDHTDVDHDTMNRAHDVIAWIVGTAAALDIPIVVTEEDTDKNGPTTPRILAYLPDDAAVLPKYAFSAPDNPDILAAIEHTQAFTCVLVGMETDICVAQSALQLQARGKRVVAITNALYSPGAAHTNGIERMTRNGVELISAKELVYDWTRTVAEVRAFRRGNPELAQPPGFRL